MRRFFLTSIVLAFFCYGTKAQLSTEELPFLWSGYYTITAQVTTACGTLSAQTTVYAQAAKSGSSASILYPNPVNDMLYVDLDKITNIQNKTTVTYDIRLYDSQGNMSHQAKSQSGIVQFNVSNMPDGIYFLHISDGVSTTPDIHKVIVKH